MEVGSSKLVGRADLVDCFLLGRRVNDRFLPSMAVCGVVVWGISIDRVFSLVTCAKRAVPDHTGVDSGWVMKRHVKSLSHTFKKHRCRTPGAHGHRRRSCMRVRV